MSFLILWLYTSFRVSLTHWKRLFDCKWWWWWWWHVVFEPGQQWFPWEVSQFIPETRSQKNVFYKKNTITHYWKWPYFLSKLHLGLKFLFFSQNYYLRHLHPKTFLYAKNQVPKVKICNIKFLFFGSKLFFYVIYTLRPSFVQKIRFLYWKFDFFIYMYFNRFWSAMTYLEKTS